ncbi:uncharacterized protein LOC111642646 [Centruroides sculpturatus]|uniref:uncharacterized protein LOC111642646 n=1 Tax=Centruroides sculpturatus TaxID=218467 RepID=UPI000C6E9C85|nr:uncharacterized protein LOC111642646 [Centruroides sculpturatus]
MYPNIKWELIKNSLTQLKINQALLELIEFAYKRNYFEVYNNFYRQTDGVSMGSKMGPKLAELVMKDIDNKIMNIPGVKTAMRYVDDYLLIFNNKITNDKIILNTINSINEDIKFDIELEKHNKIHFLDITITKEKEKYSFETYKKPSNVNKTISYYSYIPESIKKNTYIMELKKIYTRTTSKKKRKTELNELDDKFILNSYPKILLKNWHTQYYNNRFITKNKKDKNYKPFPYIADIYNNSSKCLKKDNIILAPSLTNKISNKISNKLGKYKTNTDKLKKTGTVYKINCNCQNPKEYIGETGRTLELRIKEHEAAIRLKHDNSPWYNHIKNSNCKIDRNNIKILHCEKNIYKRKFKEHIEIMKYSGNNLINISNGMQIDQQWYNMIGGATSQ